MAAHISHPCKGCKPQAAKRKAHVKCPLMDKRAVDRHACSDMRQLGSVEARLAVLPA